MLNKEGLKRDTILSIEHFGDIDKAKEYILDEFKNEYTTEEINSVFDEIQIGEYLKKGSNPRGGMGGKSNEIGCNGL
jgi:hypothetical protein